MFKGTINGVITNNVNVPINVVWNTNDNTGYNNADNSIIFKKSGYYDVAVNMVVSGTTNTTVTAQLYVNGVARPNALSTVDITATTGTETLTILDTIKVDDIFNPTFANISVRVNDNCNAVGIVTVEKRK